MALDREFRYCWEWRLPVRPEALWPLVSDTNRFNRDAGIPAVQEAGKAGGETTNRRRRLRLVRFGLAVEWEEEPFEWVRPYRFGVARRYARGPVAEMHVRAELAEAGDGTFLTYEVRARPRSLLGYLVIPLQVGVLSARSFDRVIRRYGELAAAGPPAPGEALPAPPAPVRLAPGADARLEAGRARLARGGVDPRLGEQLIEVLRTGEELTLARMRPYAFAALWGVPRREALELFLRATRAGLLDFRWDVLCPLCRGAKSRADTLRALQREVHCDACNVDFTANFHRFVELTFRPNAAIRPLEIGEFCVGGPQVTPHIVVQQLLGPGETRTVAPVLEEGRHRLHTLELAGGRYLLASAGGAAQATLGAGEDGWPEDEAEISTRPTLRLENATPQEQLFVLERTAWSDDAATAAEVTALQCFRDLFSSEVLRPNESISVGSLAVVFTDLRDSTRLYREIGDAPAFGRVRSHFDVLRDAIVPEDGAIVKTIGDAVMAVFPRPVGALRAMIQAQRTLAAAAPGGHPLFLKAGIHFGPCLAVNLSERLDYFGSTVNLAARLGSLSSGDDIVVSDEVRRDPEVAAFLLGEELALEPFRAAVKGFETEFELWRVPRRDG